MRCSAPGRPPGDQAGCGPDPAGGAEDEEGLGETYSCAGEQLAQAFRIDDGESLLPRSSFEAFVRDPEFYLASNLLLQPHGCCKMDRIESSKRVPLRQPTNLGDCGCIDKDVIVG